MQQNTNALTWVVCGPNPADKWGVFGLDSDV